MFGNKHPFVARDDHARRRRATARDVFGVAVDQEVRAFRRFLGAHGLRQKRRADRGVKNHGQSCVVRGLANGRHVERVTMRIARRLQVNIDLPPCFEPLLVFRTSRLERILESASVVAIEEFDRDIQIARFSKPIVQQLERAAVNVSRAENDVLITKKMAQGGVNGGHARVEIPSHVLRGKRPALDIDNVIGEGDRSGIEQTRINLEQRLAALEGVINPLRAGVKIGRGAGDDRCRRKDGSDVIENRVWPFGKPVGLVFDQGLVGVAKRVLERVEQFGELEAEKFLGVEISDAIAAVQRSQFAGGQVPQMVQLDIGVGDVPGQPAKRSAHFRFWIDGEMGQLLGDQTRHISCRGGRAARTQLASEFEILICG